MKRRFMAVDVSKGSLALLLTKADSSASMGRLLSFALLARMSYRKRQATPIAL